MEMTEGNTKPVSILLAEDDDVDAEGVERAFRKRKILNQIYRAHDGVEALTMMREGSIPSPYIVLVDLRMPRLDGIEFLNAIREDANLKQTVVFVLTTSEADEDKTAAYGANIAGYIVKQRAADGFLEVTEMLQRYWRVVELPAS